ncbi:MAG TPA: hypothetical protein VJ850_08410 [Candidatus Limnocylindrales bacterium]|nr:hypothetical protein [Candidatus Limnocylindrales bacterium]
MSRDARDEVLILRELKAPGDQAAKDGQWLALLTKVLVWLTAVIVVFTVVLVAKALYP